VGNGRSRRGRLVLAAGLTAGRERLAVAVLAG
jgi:hypothetical protein